MAHQIPHIMIALLIIGIFGSVFISMFFQQSVNSSVSPYWKLIPLVAIVPIIFLLLRTALSDRD